jgi:hypothetical protein
VHDEGEGAEEGGVGGIGGEEGVGVPIDIVSWLLSWIEAWEVVTYSAENERSVMFPCLPLKSPVWQVSGLLASQGGASPRRYGSK